MTTTDPHAPHGDDSPTSAEVWEDGRSDMASLVSARGDHLTVGDDGTQTAQPVKQTDPLPPLDETLEN